MTSWRERWNRAGAWRDETTVETTVSEHRPWTVHWVVEDHHVLGRVSGYQIVHHLGDDAEVFGWFADGNKANVVAEMLNRLEEQVASR